MTLLTMGEASPKLIKSDNSGLGYLSAIQYLAPASTSGRNVCPFASAGCEEACLYTAGRGRTNGVQTARLNRTHLFFDNRAEYWQTLESELATFGKRADRLGKIPSVRLNGTSDLPWERLRPELFERFSEFQFYDYTKDPKRMLRFCAGEFPENYHLTFSRSETNDRDCRNVLGNGGNVAVVFRSAEFPSWFLGAPVVNGDQHDLTFVHDAGSVLALYAKGKAKPDCSGFVVDPEPWTVQLAIIGY
jgi:hypothetical protein